jgi:uncharacterized protein DUF3309
VPGGPLTSMPTWSNTCQVFRHVGFFVYEVPLPRGRRPPSLLKKGSAMGLLLLIILVLLLLGGLPTWEHSRNWGYGPSGLLGLVLVVVVVLVIIEKIHLTSF